MVERISSIRTTSNSRSISYSLHQNRDLIYPNSNSTKYLNKENNPKNDIRIFIEKIKKLRKENTQLRKSNDELQQEIISIQNNINNSFPGYLNADKTTFPSTEKLIQEIKDFLERDCLNFYSLFLAKEFPIKRIAEFYSKLFELVQKKINSHFKTLEYLMNQTLQKRFQNSPLEYIIKKSCQSNLEKIKETIGDELTFTYIIQEIQKTFKFQQKESYKSIEELAKLTMNLFIKCYINFPQIVFKVKQIGNTITYEPDFCAFFIGNFTKGGECVIILPSFYSISANGNLKKLTNVKVLLKNFHCP